MENPTDKNKDNIPVQKKISNSFYTVLVVFFYIIIGLLFCYLKIIFGDLCRNNISYDQFTKEANPVTSRETTPSVPYYSKEDKQDYIKQLFLSNPNFIMNFVQNYSTDPTKPNLNFSDNRTTDKMLKVFFLETSYVVFNTGCLLGSFPNWVILLFWPIIFILMSLGMNLFVWIMVSYHIFSYFIGTEFFAKYNIGFLTGFIVWIIVMCIFPLNVIVTSFATFYGVIRLLLLISKQEVRVLNPSAPTIENSETYNFYKYMKDMIRSSSFIHLFFVIAIYNIAGYFSRYVAIAIVVVVLLLLFYYQGSISFISLEGLKNGWWTTNKEAISIPLSVVTENVVTNLVPKQ